MRRREFIAVLGGATLLVPQTVLAQQPGRIYRLGAMTGMTREAPQYAAFFDELRQLGFLEGKNLVVDDRGINRRFEEFPEIAIAMVNSGVDAIFCGSGDAAIRAAQHATQTVPIIGIADDMVASGLVRSLARPGGNTSGISILAHELDGKRQEILMELVTGIRRMAALADPSITGPEHLQALQDAARAHDIDLAIQLAARSEEIVPASRAGMGRRGAQCAGSDAPQSQSPDHLRAHRRAAPARHLPMARSAGARLLMGVLPGHLMDRCVDRPCPRPAAHEHASVLALVNDKPWRVALTRHH